MADLIKAERATIKFVEGLEVDGYEMPDGEFRISITGASQLLGYQENWLGRVLGRGGTVLKTLQGMGFTEQTQKLVLKSGRPNGVQKSSHCNRRSAWSSTKVSRN